MDLPAAPTGMTAQWRVEDRRLVLDLPAPGFSLAAFAPMVVMAAVTTLVGATGLVCFAVLVSRRAPAAPHVKWLIGAPFGIACFTLPAVIVLQGILWPACRRARVIASPAGLQVERRLGRLKRTKELRADELVDLALSPTGITARGKKTAIRFGEGLSERELQWIHAAVAKAVDFHR